MQEHEKRKPWRVIIPSKYQLTIIYTKCWLSLSHWDESILLSYHICIKSQQLMGPLLFLIYVNDLASVSSILFTILFADDTNVFITGKNIPNLITVMNNELSSEWMNVNKLSLNVKKTKYMLFCIKNPHIEGGNILLNGEIIDKVNHFKFLGVIIDSHLSWMDHVQHIRKKISKGIGILYKTKDYLKSDTLLTLYYSFVYPYLIYCIEVWGATTKGNLISLLKTQKRVVRMIKSVPIRTESAPLFSELKMLSVFKIYMLKLAVLMFKYHHGQVTKTIDYLFTKVSSVHDRDTRQSSQYYVPFSRKEIVRKSFRYRAAKIWNKLYGILDIRCSITSFKYHLKSYLLDTGDLDGLDKCLL